MITEPLPGTGESGSGLWPALEAILLVADEPVAENTLAQVLEVAQAEISTSLDELAASYTEQGRGFELRKVAGGWRYYTRAELSPLVEKFVRDGREVRLTQAALETLAVVAYRQPVSRVQVSAVRGVNCDSVMRTLVLRGLVEEAAVWWEDNECLEVLKQVNQLLDRALALIEGDQIEGGCRYANEQLRRIRHRLSPDIWHKVTTASRTHPVFSVMLRCPYIRYAFEKPRGYAGDAIRLRIAGHDAPPPFRYADKGSMAVAGQGFVVLHGSSPDVGVVDLDALAAAEAVETVDMTGHLQHSEAASSPS